MNIMLGIVLSVLFWKVTAITVTTYADLGCTNGGNQLPNLAYVRIIPRIKEQDVSCSTIIVSGFTDTYTFYYYDPYLPGTCSNIKSVNASVTFTTVANARELGSTIGVDLLGTFSSGPYVGLQVTTALAYTTSNLDQCHSNIGMELLTGNIVINVLGGPLCSGVAVKKYCPGIKYPDEQNVAITLPGQQPITLPIPIFG